MWQKWPFCIHLDQKKKLDNKNFFLTSKLLGFISGDSSQMSQIALVANKHDDNVAVSVIAQFLEPSANWLVCAVLGDIIDEQCTDRTTIVSITQTKYLLKCCNSANKTTMCPYRYLRAGDGTITFLSSCKHRKKKGVLDHIYHAKSKIIIPGNIIPSFRFPASLRHAGANQAFLVVKCLPHNQAVWRRVWLVSFLCLSTYTEPRYIPVSHIWALIVLLSTWILRVANSTPIVLLDSRLNSLRVKRPKRLVLPTPESPIRTTRWSRMVRFCIPDDGVHHTQIAKARKGCFCKQEGFLPLKR